MTCDKKQCLKLKVKVINLETHARLTNDHLSVKKHNSRFSHVNFQ